MDLTPEKLYQQAKEIALRRLTRKECPSKDIYQTLIRRKIPSQIAKQVVEDLILSQLIQDERYARILTRHYTQCGKGPRWIQQKLKQKGIELSSQQQGELLAEVSELSEEDQARALLERRYPKAFTDPQEARKAFQALVRRGFSFQAAQNALRTKN